MSADDDISELQELLKVAKRQRVQELLQKGIVSLQQKGANGAASHVKKVVPEPIRKAPVAPSVSYSPLPSFSWDQTDSTVKIYIFLEGASQEKTQATFGARSFDVKIHDVNGKNHRCAVHNLAKEITPADCSVLVKPKRVTVTLKKAQKGHWLDVYHKESKVKPPKTDTADPMGGIMDLMKNMYEDGDEDMKRTIAKAWEDSRSGKTPGLGSTSQGVGLGGALDF